ncbi:MAG TPA: response regulator transcription factor [Gammaproteobacteria bacterium]|nr:response regulator transcription factor [Gammaproteobacteria bacterium]
MSTQVILVSDQPVYRDELARTLGDARELAVAGTAADADRALELVCLLEPEIVLLDMGMPQAFDVARQIAQSTRRTRVVALAIREEDSEVIACAEVGIVGYVPRNGSVHDAVDAISAAARGEAHCSPRIVGSLLRRIAALTAALQSSGHADAPAGLTAREAEILALLQQGLPNKVISRRLGIELATVKNHVHAIFGKLGLRRRAQAAVLVHAAEPKNGGDDESSVGTASG